MIVYIQLGYVVKQSKDFFVLSCFEINLEIGSYAVIAGVASLTAGGHFYAAWG